MPFLPFLPAGVLFTKHPANQTVSQGKDVRLGCAVQGVAEPDVLWRKDGEKLYGTDQMFITLGEQHWETFHRWASQSALAVHSLSHANTCTEPYTDTHIQTHTQSVCMTLEEKLNGLRLTMSGQLKFICKAQFNTINQFMFLFVWR